MSITIFIPSRGRPRDAQDAANSVFNNASHADTTTVTVVVDEDDPKYEDYLSLEVDNIFVNTPSGRRGIVDPLNAAVMATIKDREHVGHMPYYIGFMGDDHRVRTQGFDAKIAARNEVIVYGDDLFQHDNLPTAVFMAQDAIRKLGYMAPPVLHHLYVDDYWRDLGNELKSIAYLPDVVIEHLHPDIMGVDGKPKGKYDMLKRELNDRDFYEQESLRYRSVDIAAEAQKVRFG